MVQQADRADCFERLLRWEDSANLWERRIGDWRFWPWIRHRLAEDVHLEPGTRPTPTTTKSASRGRKIVALALALGELGKMARRKHRGRYACLGSGRLLRTPDGRLVDPYLIGVVEAAGSNCVVLSSTKDECGKGCAAHFQTSRLWPLLSVAHRFGEREARGSKALRRTADEIQTELARLTGREAEVLKWLTREYARWKYATRVWRAIFGFLRPQLVVLTAAYARQHVLAAARAAGARVVEIQHGVITSRHFGYVHTATAPHFCIDRLLTWGSFWSQRALSVKSAGTPVVVGHAFLEKWFEAVSRGGADEELGEPRITIMSNPGFAQRLAQLAVTLRRELPERQIWFKAHPKENIGEEILGELLAAGVRVWPRDATAYEAMSRSRAVVGVWSATLIESLRFKCMPIVFMAPGWEVLEDLVAAGFLRAVETAEEVLGLLRNPDNAWENKDSELFSRFSPPGMAKALSDAFDALMGKNREFW